MFPSDPRFWSEEERKLWDQLAPALLSLVFAGGKSGHDLLPEGIRILLNWDLFNEDAVRFLRSYRLDWVAGINDYTRNRAVGTIQEWIESGEHLDVLKAKLSPLFDSDRARRIATTEVTRVYASGNELAWKATGVVGGKKWMTANDELVCPLCGPLHNTIVEIDDIFAQGVEDIVGQNADEKAIRRARSLLRSSGAFVGRPPRHVNCRCWLQPVVTEEAFRRALREGFGAFGDQDIDRMVENVRNWKPKVVLVKGNRYE